MKRLTNTMRSLTVALGTVALGLMAATGPARPAVAAETTLTVGYIPIIPMAQLFVMEGEGWTKRAGLDLKFTRFSDGPAIIQGLASGTLDVAYFGIGPAMVARSKGIDVKVLASNVVNQVALIGRGPFVDQFGRTTDAAAAFKAFHERTGRPVKIATLPRGSVPYTVLSHYLQKVAHVDPKDVEIVPVGTDKVQQALLAGAVDAGSILEPVLTVVRDRDPAARILVDGGKMLTDQPGAVLGVRGSVIADHPDAVQKLVELHVRATDFIKSNPEKAAKDVAEFVGKGLIEPDLLLKSMTAGSGSFTADPHRIVEGTQRMQDFDKESGTLAQPVDLDGLFDFRFYDAVAKQPTATQTKTDK